MIRYLVQEVYQEAGETCVEVILDDFHSEDAANQFKYDYGNNYPEIARENLRVVNYRVVE